MKNVIKPLAKSVLILLGLTAAASAGDAGIYKKILGSGDSTTLILSIKKWKTFLEYISWRFWLVIKRSHWNNSIGS